MVEIKFSFRYDLCIKKINISVKGDKKMDVKIGETIVLALIASGFGALISNIFQIVNKIIDQRNKSKEYIREDEKKYIVKKERAYIAAIERLLEIQDGFFYSREDMMFRFTEEKKKDINNSNREFIKLSPLIRLYSSDEVYNFYYHLAQYAEFSYSNGPRLIYSGRELFNQKVTILAKLMQEDLGYRVYNKSNIIIECPKCGKSHDLFSKCNCGITYFQYIYLSDAGNILKDVQRFIAENKIEDDYKEKLNKQVIKLREIFDSKKVDYSALALENERIFEIVNEIKERLSFKENDIYE